MSTVKFRNTCVLLFLPHSANLRLIHHLKQTSHHPSLPLSSIPDLKRTCSTNPSHHRSSSYPQTAHWTSTGLPSQTSYHPALCFSSPVIFLLVDACVGLNWLLVSFLSHVNKNIIHSSVLVTCFVSNCNFLLAYLQSYLTDTGLMTTISNNVWVHWGLRSRQ